MKRTITTLIIIGIICSLAMPFAASATENAVQPRWSYLDSVYAYLDINWLGVATCEGSATARSSVEIKTVVRLQQLTETGWSTIKSWSDTGTGTAGTGGKYAVARGYDYRVTVSGYVYDGNGNIVETGSSSDSDSY